MHIPQKNSSKNKHDSLLEALLTEDYDAQMKANPIWASIRGDRRFDSLLPDNRPAAQLQQNTAMKERLERAKSIVITSLDAANQVNHTLLIWELEDRIKHFEYHPERTPITQMGGPHTSMSQMASRLSFMNKQHRKDYTLRLEKTGPYLDQTRSNLKEGLRVGHTPPKIVMAGVMSQMKEQLKKNFFKIPKPIHFISLSKNFQFQIHWPNGLALLFNKAYCPLCSAYLIL